MRCLLGNDPPKRLNGLWPLKETTIGVADLTPEQPARISRELIHHLLLIRQLAEQDRLARIGPLQLLGAVLIHPPQPHIARKPAARAKPAASADAEDGCHPAMYPATSPSAARISRRHPAGNRELSTGIYCGQRGRQRI
jgi:hypothetical protein